MKKHIPNLITCMNVLSGSFAVLMVLYDRLETAAWLVLLAMVFDFFDGFAARLLHVKSEMGKELDSLADMVSFGLVPALLVHMLIRDAIGMESGFAGWNLLWLSLPMLIPAFSAYRLAKFNLDTRQSYSFIGMPTPANALFWVSLVFTAAFYPDFYAQYWENPVLLAALSLLFSCLLVMEVPMFSLKINGFSWKENKVRYLYLIVLLCALLFLGGKVLPFIIPLYVLFSLLEMKKVNLENS